MFSEKSGLYEKLRLGVITCLIALILPFLNWINPYIFVFNPADILYSPALVNLFTVSVIKVESELSQFLLIWFVYHLSV